MFIMSKYHSPIQHNKLSRISHALFPISFVLLAITMVENSVAVELPTRPTALLNASVIDELAQFVMANLENQQTTTSSSTSSSVFRPSSYQLEEVSHSSIHTGTVALVTTDLEFSSAPSSSSRLSASFLAPASLLTSTDTGNGEIRLLGNVQHQPDDQQQLTQSLGPLILRGPITIETFDDDDGFSLRLPWVIDNTAGAIRSVSIQYGVNVTLWGEINSIELQQPLDMQSAAGGDGVLLHWKQLPRLTISGKQLQLVGGGVDGSRLHVKRDARKRSHVTVSSSQQTPQQQQPKLKPTDVVDSNALNRNTLYLPSEHHLVNVIERLATMAADEHQSVSATVPRLRRIERAHVQLAHIYRLSLQVIHRPSALREWYNAVIVEPLQQNRSSVNHGDNAGKPTRMLMQLDKVPHQIETVTISEAALMNNTLIDLLSSFQQTKGSALENLM
jgi:hypothetical protein